MSIYSDTQLCDFTDYPADYRVFDGQRFCTACGKDHEGKADYRETLQKDAFYASGQVVY